MTLASMPPGESARGVDAGAVVRGGDDEGATPIREGCVVVVQESCCACAQLCVGPPNPMMARYVYALIFLVTNLLAWTLRDFGHSVLGELQRLRGCQGARYCLGAEGVLRISLGCFVSLQAIQIHIQFQFQFHFPSLHRTALRRVDLAVLDDDATALLLRDVPVDGEDEENARSPELLALRVVAGQDRAMDGLHGRPLLPAVAIHPAVWKDCTFRSRGISDDPTRQCHPVHHLAERLLPQQQRASDELTWLRCSHMQVQVVSIAAYVGSILGVVVMYVWYAPRPTCKLNIIFITVTLALVQLMAGVSLSSKVKAGYLAPGLMGVYIVFLCWTAIRSEPHTETCSRKAAVATSADWVNIASFVIAVIVIVTATFATGIDSKCFQFKKAEEGELPEDDDIPYGFGFFHFVFAMGAMYFAMLFVGWNANQTMEKWTIDVGWASTWVRIVNEWLAAIVYIWMVIAPIVWKGRQVGTSPECT
ncbi:hypothetical protein GUJ93_ZPchr0001g32339 [Zizania palustris]|uniref:Serine incorporator n=1 Tax=Zizania palustris TaxID=103762 RepID=A0A8J5SD84_ZIZPA|nr:hypothetical protein GUJ93_ZPchr0001g32339 [Zizania palustris]KAG8053169.1 hypothetical protein GUJ93_ZPchr0001g32339 [Zizania palustris]